MQSLSPVFAAKKVECDAELTFEFDFHICIHEKNHSGPHECWCGEVSWNDANEIVPNPDSREG